MYQDAFDTIARLMSNEKVIKEILFKKETFRVRWVQEKELFHFKYDSLSIQKFLEYYETFEEIAKR